ncbi:hypothetical protein Micbo1qcDRAFT_22230 [Microdochium bolleyi]|uniref:Uncharacterized protein n=1 Tax=Microdochium bolleyi TaxID=196109 RepID=A0A136IRF3_9PEZI|nr:hypothetical protein Micbo1qcDRAFT_22230 [Microdochium bolleyi]
MAAPPFDPQDFFGALYQAAFGDMMSGVTAQLQQNGKARGNTPSAGIDNKLAANSPTYHVPGVLWIVDRLIEPQTVAHFLQFACGTGDLPGGRRSALQRPASEDLLLINAPPSTWVPASHPFSARTKPFMYDVMTRVGSIEDGGRLQPISKDLHFLKSRAWEGVVPLADRAWRERGLDDLANFSQACQVITGATEVFLYLNHDWVKNALRTTYNLIYDHLLEFDQALEAKRAAETAAAAPAEEASAEDKDKDATTTTTTTTSAPPAQVAALWAEYMAAHLAYTERRAHAWVTSRIDRLADRVLRDMRAHQPVFSGGMDPQTPFPGLPGGGNGYDDAQWRLTNMWQDLMENQAYADFAMFIPVEGYKGMREGYSASGRRPATEALAREQAAARQSSSSSPSSSTPPEAAAWERQEPQRPNQLVWVHPDLHARGKLYHDRRREVQTRIIVRATFTDAVAGRPRLAPNNPENLAAGCEQQRAAIIQTRRELRGEEEEEEEKDSNNDTAPAEGVLPSTGGSGGGKKESWITEARQAEYEIVVYRGYHEHDDDAWNTFVEAFEADADDWGRTAGDEVWGADEFRGKTSFSWRNVADEYELGGDVEAIKAHFREELKDETAPAPAFSNFFLVADKASIESYLNPTPATATPQLLPGDTGAFILAVDAHFDPWAPTDERTEESPGYAGAMRLRSSMIWDDLVPGYIMQNQLIEDLWPMARVHPREMYTGPVVKAQLQAWGQIGLGLAGGGAGRGAGAGSVDDADLARAMNEAERCVPS